MPPCHVHLRANGSAEVGDTDGVRTPLVLVLTVVGVLCGCGESAEPLVERLAAAPVPSDAVEVARDERDGDFERGPEASVDYVLPRPVAATCPEVLTAMLDDGYELTDFVDEPDPITDPAAWCAAELAADGDFVTPIAIAYAADEESRFPVDGITLAFITGGDGTPDPDGTLLRLTTG